MRWFKHLTATWQDEKIAELIEEFGLEGYGFYWRILEIIAGNMDEKCQTYTSFSPKVWGKFCGISAKKFQKLAESMAKLRLFFVKVSEKNSKTIITIDCPNLLKYKDESYLTPSQLKYREYLQSPHWQKVRNEIIKARGEKCEICGATENLQVHHKTYKHLGSEENYPEDLIVVCKKCHYKIHHRGMK